MGVTAIDVVIERPMAACAGSSAMRPWGGQAKLRARPRLRPESRAGHIHELSEFLAAGKAGVGVGAARVVANSRPRLALARAVWGSNIAAPTLSRGRAKSLVVAVAAEHGGGKGGRAHGAAGLVIVVARLVVAVTAVVDNSRGGRGSHCEEMCGAGL
jgi:hypothetical protein